MIPNNVLSRHAFPNLIFGGRAKSIGELVDYESGGKGIQDPSQGLFYQVWRGRYISNQIIIDVPSDNTISPVVIFSGSGVSEFSFTFTQNMDWVLCLVQNGITKLIWKNGSSYTTTTFDDTYKHPKLSLDDKRNQSSSTSDVIFAYVRNNNLCYRQQRENYATERVIAENINGRLVKFSMGSINRLQFVIAPNQ